MAGLKNVVKSADVASYKLTKPLLALLEKVTKMDQYMQAAGVKPQPFIRLYRHDLADLDKAIRYQSEGEYSISTTLFKGRKIIANDEPEPSFKLEAEQ